MIELSGDSKTLKRVVNDCKRNGSSSPIDEFIAKLKTGQKLLDKRPQVCGMLFEDCNSCDPDEYYKNLLISQLVAISD